MPDLTATFPGTDWSEVRQAGGDGESARRALATLLERYLPALRRYLIARWNQTSDRAGDLLQEFILQKVLEGELVRRADRSRGRFRSLLMTALDRHILDVMRRESAARRSPTRMLSLEGDLAADDVPQERAPDLFDIAWAKQVLEMAARRMREECHLTSRAAVWQIFELRVFLPTLEQAEPLSYEALRQRLGFESVEQASNLLITAKRMFARTLRAVVREYAADDAEVEEELLQLKRALSRG